MRVSTKMDILVLVSFWLRWKTRNDLIETFEIDFDFKVFLVLFFEICQRQKDNQISYD